MFVFFGRKVLALFFSPDRGDCRSRIMLKNEYLVAKIGVDTAEDEPTKIWRQSFHFFRFFEIYSRPYRAKKKCKHFSSPEKKIHLAESCG